VPFCYQLKSKSRSLTGARYSVANEVPVASASVAAFSIGASCVFITRSAGGAFVGVWNKTKNKTFALKYTFADWFISSDAQAVLSSANQPAKSAL